MRLYLAQLVLATTVFFFCQHPLLAAEAPCATKINKWTHYLRHDWGNGVQSQAVLCAFFDGETGYHYGPDQDQDMVMCECSSHKTTHGGHPYEHYHFNHSFPVLGLVDNVWRSVTAAMKEAHWDHFYLPHGYTKVGTYSTSQNCYGHAFEVGTQVNDGTYGAEVIIGADWEDAGEDDAQAAYLNGIHAIKVFSNGTFITKTSEKSRSSAIYERSDVYQLSVPQGFKLLKKK